MQRNQMIAALHDAVRLCIEDAPELGADTQIAIDPKNFEINVQTVADRDHDIDDSDATVEADAVAEGLADQDGMDYQSGRNWDLYPVDTLVAVKGGRRVPDDMRISKIVDTYIAEPDNSRTPYTF